MSTELSRIDDTPLMVTLYPHWKKCTKVIKSRLNLHDRQTLQLIIPSSICLQFVLKRRLQIHLHCFSFSVCRFFLLPWKDKKKKYIYIIAVILIVFYPFHCIFCLQFSCNVLEGYEHHKFLGANALDSVHHNTLWWLLSDKSINRCSLPF